MGWSLKMLTIENETFLPSPEELDTETFTSIVDLILSLTLPYAENWMRTVLEKFFQINAIVSEVSQSDVLPGINSCSFFSITEKSPNSAGSRPTVYKIITLAFHSFADWEQIQCQRLLHDLNIIVLQKLYDWDWANLVLGPKICQTTWPVVIISVHRFKTSKKYRYINLMLPIAHFNSFFLNSTSQQDFFLLAIRS